jgi:hypothetical protein
LLLATPTDSRASPPLAHAVPAQLRQRLVGCWELGSGYRVVFQQVGASGLRAEQRATPVGPTSRVLDERVLFDAQSNSIGFRAIAQRHTTIVRLWWEGNVLRFVFSSRRRRGDPWHDGIVDSATRCP